MTARATFTEAQIKRVLKAARAVDPKAVVQVTPDRGILILPPESQTRTEVDEWFGKQNDAG